MHIPKLFSTWLKKLIPPRFTPAHLSVKAAKRAIFSLFLATVLFTGGLFFVAENGLFLAADKPSGEAQMQIQQSQLSKEMALSAQLTQLEGELEAARTENTALNEENAQLNNATVTLLDSLKLEYVGEYYATAYCCERYPHICGGNGVTASGTVPTPGITCAADWNVLPPGTWLYIEGVGLRRVEDSGSAIKGKRLDIAIDTHQNALRWAGQGSHHTWVLQFDGALEN